MRHDWRRMVPICGARAVVAHRCVRRGAAREVRSGPGEGLTIFPEIGPVTDPTTVGEVDER
ncbi:hypothetical protein [Streptomyces sp. NPDC057580]|uniref:hypothetical protein n=1 Tax=Streptomyces sp. NPDC057580 TaxID=3346173 RepID=UPI0036BBC350